MDELTVPLLPRCSTVLDASLEDPSLSPLRLKTSLNSSDSVAGPLSNLSRAIESLNLVPVSPIATLHSNSLWFDDGVTDSDYRSASAKSLDVVFESSGEELSLKSADVRVLGGRQNVLSRDVNLSDPLTEPEADILEQFRRFGVRFIRHADQYSGCGCQVPHALVEWSLLLNEVAMTSNDPLPMCFHYRWAEVKQDFDVDVFGDLQFQDFLLAREHRGQYHAMIHFAGIFANVGYDGSYWYWVLLGEGETPFLESKYCRKANFVDSLRTMVREQFRLHKRDTTLCPEPMPNAHFYVRTAEMPFELEPDDHVPKIRMNLRSRSEEPSDLVTSLENVATSPLKNEARVINGQRAPKALSYLQLYCDSYSSFLSSL
ncbi:hypothetical protein BIW11_02028 [Tropilaelaps mercedesae]|uniref:Uncharacterized protein n=1 Tax=Tropilaelaps mercedesae TaxID=418985 RepID=A0A1V9X4B7_9ACAR|nr:hypothetical protein BIW11_02028 [Tropilaelaps mercedesae]